MTQTKEQQKQTPDQRRARHAWDVIQKILTDYPHRFENKKKVPDARAKKFGGQAKKLPTRILASGLGQALAFLYAKDDAPNLLQALGDWILNKPERFDLSKAPEKRTLLDKIVNQWGTDELRRATDESLVYLQWLNRFAEAEGLTDTEGE